MKPTRILLVFCVLLALAGLAIGCGWPQTDQSIRFNGFRLWREMGRLPFLIGKQPSHGALQRERGEELEAADRDETYRDSDSARAMQIDTAWNQANTARLQSDLVTLRTRLQQYLQLTAPDQQFVWTEITDRRLRRNSAIDQLDALTALSQGSSDTAVVAYLDARNAFDAGRLSEDIEKELLPIANDHNLRDNAEFLRATYLYGRKDYSAAGVAFETFAARYHTSEKRPAALYLSALCEMKLQKERTNESQHNGDGLREERASGNDPWLKTRNGFTRVLHEYPRGQYAADARGWLAHIWLEQGNRAAALTEYYRMLSDENNNDSRIEALKSLNLVTGHATDDDMKKVEAMLTNEPAAALTYAYYEISKHPQSSVDFSAYAQKSSEKQKNTAALARIADFADSLMKRYPKAVVNNEFVLRVAMAKLELGDFATTSRLAARALSGALPDDERARALWVKGIADYRLGNLSAAGKSLTALLSMKTNEEMKRGARENLALIAEDRGDLDGALEQYISLKYQLDVAYLVDVLMTPEQLGGFINRHPTLDKKDELLYGLGVRYLRVGRWADARKAFSGVHTIVRVSDEEYGWKRYRGNYPKEKQDSDLKDPYLADWTVEGVRANWVQRDIQTADDLEHLEQLAKTTEGDEAKAEALYQFASYQYQATDYLYYNPAAWQGERYINLAEFDLMGQYRSPNEAQTLWQYYQLHEPVVHALNIYLEIVDHYPNTRAARDSLYTAAICHLRLADYNDYWRNVYPERHAGTRMVRLKDVTAKYPNYQMPRGTSGWQPSTRTVNGGPGWSAPPRHLPPQPKWRTRLDKFNKYILPMFQRVFERLDLALHLMLDLLWSVIWWNVMLRLIALIMVAWRQAVRAQQRFLKDLPYHTGAPIALLGPARTEFIRNQRPGPLANCEIDTGWFQVLQPKLKELSWRLFHTRAGVVMAVRILTHAPFLMITLFLFSHL